MVRIFSRHTLLLCVRLTRSSFCSESIACPLCTRLTSVPENDISELNPNFALRDLLSLLLQEARESSDATALHELTMKDIITPHVLCASCHKVCLCHSFLDAMCTRHRLSFIVSVLSLHLVFPIISRYLNVVSQAFILLFYTLSLPILSCTCQSLTFLTSLRVSLKAATVFCLHCSEISGQDFVMHATPPHTIRPCFNVTSKCL